MKEAGILPSFAGIAPPESTASAPTKSSTSS